MEKDVLKPYLQGHLDRYCESIVLLILFITYEVHCQRSTLVNCSTKQ